ncbi:MAG: hypothetical protein WA373_04830 [Burkholderiales bacterium]
MALVEVVKKKPRQQKSVQLFDVIETAEAIAKTARRHRQSLSGGGFYATKFAESHAEALNGLRDLQARFRDVQDDNVVQTLVALGKHLQSFFDPATKSSDRGRIKQQILLLIRTSILPMLQQTSSHVPSDKLFPLEIVKGTRPYIEKVALQACGCYDLGWFDGASVMARRLLETLIIELYEAKKLDHKIKKPDGAFQYLSGLISVMLSETAFNLGRNTKGVLPVLKDLGDQSAHNRRYTARQQDLDSVKRELRVTIEELVHLTGYK